MPPNDQTYGLKHDLVARDFTMQKMLDLYESKGRWMSSSNEPNKKQLSKEQLETMWDIYREAGSPFIKILKEGSVGAEGDVNRAFYDWNYDLRGDTANVFKHNLLSDWIAEMTHGVQMTQKEEESLEDWINRRKKKMKRTSQEKKDFGRMRYGIKGDMTYEIIDEENQPSKVVDQYGQERYSMTPPLSKTEDGVSRRTLKWIEKRGDKLFPVKSTSGHMHYESYSPETGFGRNYGRIPIEFDAHEKIEPTLWRRIFGKYEDELSNQEKLQYLR